MHVLTGVRKIAGALPERNVLEHGAACRGPFMGGGRAYGVEQIATRGAGEGAEAHGRVGHAERRVADLRDRHRQFLRHDGHGIEIRGLALIGGHAGGGVALDVFDGDESLARGERQVLGGHVVLPIDEGLVLGSGIRHRQSTEIAFDAARERIDGECAWRRGGGAGRGNHARAGFGAVGQGFGQIEHAAAGTGGALGFRGLAGDERFQRIAPGKLAARLREQMHARGEAPGHQHGIAIDGLEHAHGCRRALARRAAAQRDAGDA
jgi:hypothetical protein